MTDSPHPKSAKRFARLRPWLVWILLLAVAYLAGYLLYGHYQEQKKHQIQSQPPPHLPSAPH